MQASVALVLVSHDGARWLPTVIDGIRAQRVPPCLAVAVDTGSRDESPELLEAAFESVIRANGRTTFPQAVALALEQLRGLADAPEWVWILHDDANPDQDALAALVAATEEYPDADVLGPKLREWPSLRRLLEVGVTISGTGRRETGLERAEYDQGQHDAVRTVLAVNTAGMLVRRDVLESLGGFDRQLPMFGNDIDFGWRAATAGYRTIVVPQAVVFHAEAAHRGVRRTPLTGRHTHYQERRAALYTLLANSRARSLPFKWVRLALGTFWRMLGFLFVRDVGSALDDLAALINVYSRPFDILKARRQRRRRRSADPRDVRRLLAPTWLPYRHGLDFVGDVASALTNQASDVAERRRIAKAEADPASFAARRQTAIEDADEDELLVENGWVVRFFTNPVAVLLTLVGILGIVAGRVALGDVGGGGLAPVPASASDWWALHFDSWHELGQGTAIPAPPYVLPLALLASIVGPGWAVTLVMILAFPIALGGAWRLLRVVGRLVSHRGAPRWLILWGATTYALVPGVSGAWGDGRLGPVVAGAVLPWLAHAALHFADPETDRRWRAAWRSGLLLALTAAFAPTAWLVAVLLGAVVLVISFRIVPGSVRDRAVWGPPAVSLLIPPVLLLPWWLPAIVHGGAAGLLLDPGRLPAPTVSGLHLVVGRLDGLGAPWWLGVALPFLALVALIPARTRIPVLVCWIAGTTVAVVALLLSLVRLDLAAGTTGAGSAFPLVALQGAAVVAAVLGAQGVLLDGVRGWRRPFAALFAVVALVSVVGGLGWFLVSGSGQLTDDTSHLAHQGVPAYMLDTTTHDPAQGVLVLRGSVDHGLRYTVLRGDGQTMGVDEILATTPEDTGLSNVVRQLADRPGAGTLTRLAAQGISYVVMPTPADHHVAEGIDASGGVTQASTADPGTRAWQLDDKASAPGLDGPGSPLRLGLLIVQLVGLVVVLVFCVPTMERRRAR